jgi:hypothetical protein
MHCTLHKEGWFLGFPNFQKKAKEDKDLERKLP